MMKSQLVDYSLDGVNNNWGAINLTTKISSILEVWVTSIGIHLTRERQIVRTELIRLKLRTNVGY